jgi:uncharacterized protein YifE (UPF0438 family)
MQSRGAELVESLATITQTNGKVRRHHSFASKFAHFLINEDRFPIMDKYANRMVKRHIGPKNFVTDPKKSYVAFCANHRLLKEQLSFQVSNRDLDHYLWIAGLYLAYTSLLGSAGE